MLHFYWKHISCGSLVVFFFVFFFGPFTFCPCVVCLSLVYGLLITPLESAWLSYGLMSMNFTLINRLHKLYNSEFLEMEHFSDQFWMYFCQYSFKTIYISVVLEDWLYSWTLQFQLLFPVAFTVDWNSQFDSLRYWINCDL